MVEEKIKKLIEENEIPEDADITAVGLSDFAKLQFNILKEFTEKIIDNLNVIINHAVMKNKLDMDIAELFAKTLNSMLNEAMKNSFEYIMENLPEFFKDNLLNLDDMSECDGTA